MTVTSREFCFTFYPYPHRSLLSKDRVKNNFVNLSFEARLDDDNPDIPPNYTHFCRELRAARRARQNIIVQKRSEVDDCHFIPEKGNQILRPNIRN